MARHACGVILFALLVSATAISANGSAALEPVVEGERRVWHPLGVSFQGPHASETDDQPNPFLGHRLQVTFRSPSGRTFNVPGYFAGDGRGGESGNVWRARFTPDEPGEWTFKASFRSGDNVAVSLDPGAGQPVAPDGESGEVSVRARDPAAPGFLRWGRLEYVGKHYLKFRDGPYWIRGGTDSPENFLAYAGFDNTPPNHKYAAHIEDWRPGDPDWGGGKGRGIIGALNYLAEKHVNSVYFLTMNIGGDGGDVWPWTGTPEPKGSPQDDNLHYDISKLRGWETVFAHAQRKGIFLHFVLNEAEAPNKRELDEGELRTERRLYYRELIARFGHHLAMEWNLCEEYNLQFDFGPDRIRAFAGYIKAVDPYDHPIAVHSAGDPLEKLKFTFGDERFSLTSVQLNQRPIERITEDLRKATAGAGRPLPASLDEFTVFGGQTQSHLAIDDAEKQRREKLWPTYLSGGMIEYILEGFLEVDTFKTDEREKLWNYTWSARRFVEEHLPYWEMQPADELVGGAATVEVQQVRGRSHQLGAQVFAKPGEVYAIYLPRANPAGQVDLSGASGPMTLRWYNPRTGKFEGGSRKISGGGRVAIGAPPSAPEEDWVILIES